MVNTRLCKLYIYLYIIYICICKKMVSHQLVGQSVHCAEMLLMSSIGEACNWSRKSPIFGTPRVGTSPLAHPLVTPLVKALWTYSVQGKQSHICQIYQLNAIWSVHIIFSFVYTFFCKYSQPFWGKVPYWY